MKITSSAEPQQLALAHDSFTQLGGAERVVRALHKAFPEAYVYTLVVDPSIKPHISQYRVVQTWLKWLYPFVPGLQWLLPFIPFAVWTIQPRADILLSSSSSFAKGIRLKKPGVHINYCHTPTRFIWIDRAYINQEVPILLRPLAKIFLHWLKLWDLRASEHVDYFIANSQEVQKRIAQYYHRHSVVIHPGVDIDFWKPSRAKQNYFLIAGRLHAHKGNQAVIEACTKLGLPLHVVGTGRQEQYLRKIAGPTVIFLGRVSDQVLRDEYSGALGFIYPPLEDFGLMPIEAASCGTATLALSAGGSLETVVPGVTGDFFSSPTVQEISEKLTSWNQAAYTQEALRKHARMFSEATFRSRIKEFVQQVSE